jgi:hypothetical protein
MENYKPNSHRSKAEQRSSNEERQKLEKVVSGTAKVKKKGATRKFTDVFISEDASNVKTYIISDVLVPAAKKLVSDIVRDGIEMLLYGSTGGSSKRSSRTPYVSYDRFSDRRDDRRYSSEPRARFDYNDIVFETRGEAEIVRSQMDDVIDRYGFVTVADMYDLAGLTEPYTSNKYGWTNIRNAEPIRVRDGYILKLPRPVPID